MSTPSVIASIESGIERGLHIGAQVVASIGGTVVTDLAIGTAREGVSMAPGTLMPWFSGSKPVTATAVLQMVERGRLGLDDQVASHLPACGVGGKQDITVRHLLLHTAGFRDPGLTPSQLRAASWDESMAAICASPLEPGWVPGETAGYHPLTSYQVLGALVQLQDLEGRAFVDYVAEEIFEPCDMADSWMSLSADRYRSYGDRMAVPIGVDRGEQRIIGALSGPDAYEPVFPGGGAVGPMGDLVRFYEMLLGGGERAGHRVLGSAMAADMVRPHRVGAHDLTFRSVLDWGLGVMTNSWKYQQKPGWYGYGDHAGDDAFGHGGVGTLVSFADPQHRLAVALAFNGQLAEAANHARTQPVINALYDDLGLSESASTQRS
ncbi:MAG: serine hydrolase domain-containing protein [Acidimicrobiales bacterium]